MGLKRGWRPPTSALTFWGRPCRGLLPPRALSRLARSPVTWAVPADQPAGGGGIPVSGKHLIGSCHCRDVVPRKGNQTY